MAFSKGLTTVCVVRSGLTRLFGNKLFLKYGQFNPTETIDLLEYVKQNDPQGFVESDGPRMWYRACAFKFAKQTLEAEMTSEQLLEFVNFRNPKTEVYSIGYAILKRMSTIVYDFARRPRGMKLANVQMALSTLQLMGVDVDLYQPVFAPTLGSMNDIWSESKTFGWSMSKDSLVAKGKDTIDQTLAIYSVCGKY